MRNIRITSLLLIATLTLGIAGCSEGNSINPANSDEAVRTSISVSSDETTAITRETDEMVATTRETKTEEIEKTVGVETKEAEKTVETALPKSNAVWKEVPIVRDFNRPPLKAAWPPFDLKESITGNSKDLNNYTFNTYVFKGTVIGLKEYEVTWINESNEERGPFSRTIIEVRINKEYHGKLSVNGDIVRVLYTISLSDTFNDSVHVKEGVEYVFANCWVLDDTYTNYEEKYNRDSLNSGSREYADIILGGTRWGLFPIEGENIILNYEYFEHDENAKRKNISYQEVKTEMLTSKESLESGKFIVMRITDFEEEFTNLIKNAKDLPNEIY